jgi:hypothetical protein
MTAASVREAACVAARRGYPAGMRWVLAAALALFPCSVQAAQEDLRRELVDEDYRFRIVSPGKSWRILDEAEARTIIPDAIAILYGPGGLFAAVVVEHVPGVELAAMARIIHDGMELEERVDESYAELEFHGRPAVRFQVTGRIDGRALRFQNTVFAHGDFVYQLVCTGAVDRLDADARALETVHAAFTLLDGAPRARSTAFASPDVRGHDWRLQDGVFRSAAYGLELAPPARWRVVVGPELDGMNTSAEVGAICSSPDVFLVVIPEHVHGSSAADMAAGLARDFAAGEPVDGPFAVRIDGADVVLRAYEDSNGLTFLHGAFARDALCTQVLAWFGGPRDAQRKELVAAALGGLRFTAEEERVRLAAELAALPDPDDEVGADHSLRAGVYRDYGAALTFRRPDGWRIRAGQGVRAEYGETARLELEHPRSGLYAVLSAWEPYGSPAEEHEESVLAYLLEGEVAGVEIDLAGVPALESIVRSATGPSGAAQRVITAQGGDLSYELVFFGFDGNLVAGEAAIVAAREAFRLGAAPAPQAVRDGVYHDEKLGFELARPAPGWRANTELVPGDAGALAGSCGWTSAGGQEVFAIAIGGLTPGADERAQADLMLGEIASNVRGEPEERPGTLDGLPARHLTFEGRGQRIEVLVARRANALFLLGVSGRGDEPTLARAQELFAFLP